MSQPCRGRRSVWAAGAQQEIWAAASLETTAGAMFSLSLCCFVTRDVLFQLPTPHLRSSSIFAKVRVILSIPAGQVGCMQARSCWHDSKTGREEEALPQCSAMTMRPPPPQPGPLPGVSARLLCPHCRRCSACLLVPGHIWEGRFLNLRDLNMLQAFLF